jgi:hypothetical protein
MTHKDCGGFVRAIPSLWGDDDDGSADELVCHECGAVVTLHECDGSEEFADYDDARGDAFRGREVKA